MLSPRCSASSAIIKAGHIITSINFITKMKAIHMISFILVIIGALNWLLVGFGYNLVDAIFGAGSIISKIIYILVGLAAIILVLTHKKDCKNCQAPAPTM